MSTSVTKKAYARGIGEVLQQNGLTQFPNQETMKLAADHAAQVIGVEPSENHVSDQECVKVAQVISSISEEFRSRGKTASYPQGVSIGSNAQTAIGDMIEKVAKVALAEQQGGDAPTAVGMGDHGNTLPAAAGESDLAAKEQVERPENYARIQPGGGNIGEGAQANIGKEQDHPKKPMDAPGSNSVTQASKSASVAETLRKLGMDGQEGGDSPTAVGMKDHGNTLPAAANESDVAKQENMNRPENYANVGQGNANIGESSKANIGEEQDHPDKPQDAPGSNSVTQASKSASVEKLAHARQTGSDVMEQTLRTLAQLG